MNLTVAFILERKLGMDRVLAVGLLRHFLQVTGGVLLARGVVDPAGWDLIAGAVTSVGTAGWYLWSRKS